MARFNKKLQKNDEKVQKTIFLQKIQRIFAYIKKKQ